MKINFCVNTSFTREDVFYRFLFKVVAPGSDLPKKIITRKMCKIAQLGNCNKKWSLINPFLFFTAGRELKRK